MCQITLNSHAKFHGDRTIGGAITVNKLSKHNISIVINVNCKKNVHIFTHTHDLYHMIEHRILNNFVSGVLSSIKVI